VFSVTLWQSFEFHPLDVVKTQLIYHTALNKA